MRQGQRSRQRQAATETKALQERLLGVTSCTLRRHSASRRPSSHGMTWHGITQQSHAMPRHKLLSPETVGCGSASADDAEPQPTVGNRRRCALEALPRQLGSIRSKPWAWCSVSSARGVPPGRTGMKSHWKNQRSTATLAPRLTIPSDSSSAALHLAPYRLAAPGNCVRLDAATVVQPRPGLGREAVGFTSTRCPLPEFD
mmetsp:Transcript_138234/g.311465  ORF Transcript_138234/g.311465 Transcript_138234/m.311465 type:complete len:200 (+) Transcript_138234:226-825(+)